MKIDKNIPIPPGVRGNQGPREPTSVFSKMEVGDSILFTGSKIVHATSLAQSHGIRYDKKFISRLVTEDGIRGRRVWRVY